MQVWLLERVSASFMPAILVAVQFLVLSCLIGIVASEPVLAQEPTLNQVGVAVTGRVLSATDAKPLTGIRLTLADHSATTDAAGRFTFLQPPTGYQLVKIHPSSLDASRKRMKDGSRGGLMHADPVLVNVSSDRAIELSDPIWVVETHPMSYPITPGRKTDIKPAHIPGLTIKIPDGATITEVKTAARTRA